MTTFTKESDFETAVIHELRQHGINPKKLTELMSTNLTEVNLNEYGRFDDLKLTVNQEMARAYFDGLEGAALPLFRVNIKAADLLKRFILAGGLCA